MHAKHDGFHFERHDMWREGKWLDLWSVVHFLSGASIGLGLFILSFGPRESVLLTFVALVAYELWEALEGMAETPQNRTMDVVVGMASFLPTYFLLAPDLPADGRISVFFIVFILNVGMSYFGWRASRKAAALKRRLRERYKEQRAKLLRRRTRLRNKNDLD